MSAECNGDGDEDEEDGKMMGDPESGSDPPAPPLAPEEDGDLSETEETSRLLQDDETPGTSKYPDSSGTSIAAPSTPTNSAISDDIGTAKQEGSDSHKDPESESEEPNGELLDPDFVAANAATTVAYDQPTSYAQPPKLEVIDEHEILETLTPAVIGTTVVSPTGEETFEDGILGHSTPGGSGSNLDYGDNTNDDRYSIQTPRESTDYLGEDASRGPNTSEPTLPKNYTEPSNLSTVFRRVGTFTRRLFGSTTVTPSDSLVSLEFAVPHAGLGNSHSGHHRGFRRGGNLSSRNSVSSEASSLQVGKRKSSADNQRRRMPPVAPPTGELLSRSRRFLRGGTGNFLHAKGTSAISLRPPEPSSGLPSPCGECPHCRKFLKMGEPGIPLRALGESCPCRVCTILEENTPGAPTRLTKQAANRGKTPGGLGPLRPSLPSDYGIFCEACNQSGYMSPNATCGKLGSQHNHSGLNPNVVITGTIVDQPSNCPSMDSIATSTNFPRQLSIKDTGCQVSRQLSMTSVGTSGPACRICHSPADKDECLISPCRCSGTLRYVHMSCLVHWLEISCRKLRKPPQCELCGYRYQRRKIFKLRNCTWPKCSLKDKILHSIFIISVLAMIFCAVVTIICFKAEKGEGPKVSDVSLSVREVVTLICGVMFFCAFFVAMYVQVKATTTIYKLMVRFWLMNHEWFVDEYRPEKDPEYIRRMKIRAAAIAAAQEKKELDEIAKEEEEQANFRQDVHFRLGKCDSEPGDLDSISAFSSSDGELHDSGDEVDEPRKDVLLDGDFDERVRTIRLNSRSSLQFGPRVPSRTEAHSAEPQ